MTHDTSSPQVLAAVNRYEIEEPFFSLLSNLHGKKVLDIGCGDGRYSLKMRRLGAATLGIDIDPARIEAAKELEDAHLVFHCADATTLSLDQPVEVITAMMMLNELPKAALERVFSRLPHWLKFHGRFIFAVPHPFNYHEHTEITERSGLNEADYFHDGQPFTTTYQDKDGSVTVTDHHYSLGYLCGLLRQHSFQIRNIVEPRMPSAQEERYARYPFYLIVEAIKSLP